MSRSSALYLVAWLVVPLAFATYLGVAYARGLNAGLLPFIGIHEWKWWVAFAVSLVVGAGCFVAARATGTVRWKGWTALYVAAMSVILVGIHVAVACSRGDCL